MNMAIELDEKPKSLIDYLKVVKRRKKQLLFSACITLGIAILAALFWPPTYRSSATILIEEQEIPQDLVRSTITSYANQQIQTISQRILTLNNIMDIVTKFGLLDPDELKRTPRTEIVKDFQRSMDLQLVSADVIDPRLGRPTQATIAFTLSFDDHTPILAQKVANELANLYLNENLKSRNEKTATTSEFLRSESDSLHNHIKDVESKLATFKRENEGALPELYQYNLNVIDRTNAELNDAKARLAQLEKRKLELSANMSQISPYAPTTLPTGEKVLSDHDRLKALLSEYRNKSALYSADHPDIIRLKREIEALKKELGTGLTAEDYAEQLQIEKDKLAKLKQTYTAGHPEVLKQQRVVDTLIKERDTAPANPQIEADNPAYVLLETQLKSAETDSSVLKQNIAGLKDKISKFEGYLSKAPNVEKSYTELMRDLQTTTAKYEEIKAKLMEAELAQNLEAERKGERFTLIEPPILPDEPVKPNRIAILLIGIVMAGIVGAGTAGFSEMLDDGVQGSSELEELLGSTPLATIPYLLIDSEQKSNRKIYWLWGGLVIVALVIALIIINFLVAPLDVIWYVVLRKLGIGY